MAIIFTSNQPNSGGLYLNPNLKVKCDTKNRTVQTSASTVALIEDMDTPRCISRDGTNKALLLEKATTNLIDEQYFNNWLEFFTPVATSATTPAGTTEICQVTDDNASGTERFYLDTGALSAQTITLSSWIYIDETSSSLRYLLAETASATGVLIDISSTTPIGAWNFRSGTNSTAGLATSFVMCGPAWTPASNLGIGRWFGMQCETGAYPTSFIGSDNSTFTRAADICYTNARNLCDDSGRYDITIKFKTPWDVDTAVVAGSSFPNVIYFNSNNRLYCSMDGDNEVRLVVNGTEILTDQFYWSPDTEVTIRIQNDGTTATLTLSGASSGNGTYTGSGGTFTPSTYAYICSTNTAGAVQNFEVTHLESDQSIKATDPNKIEWSAANSDQGNGLMALPGWMNLSCATAERSARNGVATVNIGYAANTARAYNNGFGAGLIIDKETINRLQNHDLTSWSTVGTPLIESCILPTGVVGNNRVTDDDPTTNSERIFTNFTSGGVIETWSAWANRVSGGGTSVSRIRDAGTIALIIDFSSPEDQWALVNGTADFSGTGAESFVMAPRNTVTDIGSTDFWGMQVEAGSYPTSFIGADNSTFTRVADTLTIPTYTFVDSGYFNVTFTFRPHFDHDEVDDFTVFHISDDWKLIWNWLGVGAFQFTVNGVTIDIDNLSVTWSRNQEITIRAVYSATERSIYISGATTGNGSNEQGGDAAGDFDGLDTVSLFGDESVDLLYLNTNVEFAEAEIVEDGGLGAGLSEFGQPAVGFGTVETTTAFKKVIWKGEDNYQQSQRMIDPTTGDYKMNSNGLLIGMNAVQQAVYLALVTVRNTSVVRELGQRFSNIPTIKSNIQSTIQEEVRIALSDLINQGKVELINVFVDREPLNPQRLRILIQWRNLLTNAEEATRIGL